MKAIFEEYGSIIAAVVGVVLFIIIIKLVVGNDANSVVYKAFMDIFQQLFNNTGLSDLTSSVKQAG